MLTVDNASQAENLLARAYGLEQAKCSLIARGLNDTYLVELPGENSVLRVYRPSWRSTSEIEYELAFIRHLELRSVAVSYALPKLSGDLMSSCQRNGHLTWATLFTCAPGSRLDLNVANSYQLGNLAAQVHLAGADFPPSPDRFDVDAGHLITEPIHALKQTLCDKPAALKILQSASALLLSQLEAIRGDLKWGPCHGDLHDYNAHVDTQGKVTLFDFDCCGFGWFAYDIAVFKWAVRREANADDLFEAFLNGYRSLRPLGEAEISALPMFMRIRDIWLAGVHASNPDVFGAGLIGDHYLAGLCGALEQYQSLA